ncbi:unnamed protein product [Medioppia subpectinata]|uniref:Uncharacterized protein n=1 Tax=Medioppia subpectinata TaxID=1979941 RepID=A0A7R9PX69_9ACAR|nr:unnamed protein product [Medioppia subpectinata]CAG2104505.1 unnamed protein product [Medioppia subpectinata]
MCMYPNTIGSMDVLPVITVEPIAFVFMFATFGEYTCAQDLLFTNNCVHYFQSNQCLIDKSEESDALLAIESQTTQQLMYYNSILAIASIFSSFISGSYGDSCGRLVPLSVPPLLSFIVQCLFIISSFRLSPAVDILPLVLICSLISGLSGGSSSFLANCFGFVSDKSRQKQRTQRLVILEANVFCGAFLGSITTDLCQMRAKEKEWFPELASKLHLWDGSVDEFIVSVCTEPTTPLGHIFFGATGLALCLLPLAQYYLLPQICDTSIAIIGILSRTLGLILIGLATNSGLMFSSIILLTFCEFPLPAIRSLLSKLVDTTERGKVFAFLTLFHNLCSLSGGILFPLIYKNAINNNRYSGLCFQITAALQVMAMSLFIYIRYELKSAHFVQTANESTDPSETNSILDEDNGGADNDNTTDT